ncbi:UNKNOWN [Stylonychia lemnae]|uniref:GOLD domain-containing protein n=1 Tax=Stylonychia lemnae TaxID=5949 RepID=A0A078AFH5_STYLE|nr:UNKNOWN [Stylonychia lemnae]|eukprot:CDW80272.1 UNKNOWN [Stylonychia lemnae]
MGKINDPSHKVVTVQPVKQQQVPTTKGNQEASNNQNVETQQALILGDTQRVKFNDLDNTQKPLESKQPEVKTKQSRNESQNDHTKFETNDKMSSPPMKQNIQGTSQDKLEGKQTNSNDDFLTFNDDASRKENTKSVIHQTDEDKVFKLPEIQQRTHRVIEEKSQHLVQSSNRVSLEQEYQDKQMSKLEIKKEAQRIKDAIGTQRSTLSQQNVELNQQMATNYINDLFNMFSGPPPTYNQSIVPVQTQIIQQESPQRNHEQAQTVVDYQQASSFNDSEQRGSNEHQRSSGTVPRAIFQDEPTRNQTISHIPEESSNYSQSVGKNVDNSQILKSENQPAEELKLQDKIKVETDEPEAEDKITSKPQVQESLESRNNESSKKEKSDTQSSSTHNFARPGFTHSSVETEEVDYDVKVARSYVQKLMSTQINNHQQFSLPPQSSQSNRGTVIAPKETTPFQENPIKLETSQIQDGEEADFRSDSEIQREMDPGTVSEIDPEVYNKDIFEDDSERNSQVYASQVEKFMSDLLPIDMLTVELEPYGEQIFYMKVDHYPSKLKFAYSITSSDPRPIDLIEYFSEYNIHKQSQFGRYGIKFVNKDSNIQDITFAYKLVKKTSGDQGMSPSDAAPTSEEAALFSSLEEANAEMGHFMTENKFQNFRMEGYVHTVQNTTQNSLYSTVLEILIMIGLGAFQVYHLKKVLDNKRMI